MINRDFFFAHARQRPFGGSLKQSQVDGMSAILDAWDKSGLTDTRWLAYALGTTFHETARTMQPIEEYGKGKGHPYGLPDGPWHQIYDGRGDVQLTWLKNYQKASVELQRFGYDVDLAHNPDLAMRSDIAAAILIHGMAEGWFTGKKLADYFGPNKADPVNARRIINGLDQASAVASYYFAFVAALTLAAPAPAIASPGPLVVPAAQPATGFWARFFAALTGNKAA